MILLFLASSLYIHFLSVDLYKGLWVNFKRENLSICINVEFVGVTIERYFENVLLRDHFECVVSGGALQV